HPFGRRSDVHGHGVGRHAQTVPTIPSAGAAARVTIPPVPATPYDEIGRTYARTRREDPRVAATIHACLGDGATVLNVGAGTGSYEPPDRFVLAVEPSTEMLRQRPEHCAPVVR